MRLRAVLSVLAMTGVGCFDFNAAFDKFCADGGCGSDGGVGTGGGNALGGGEAQNGGGGVAAEGGGNSAAGGGQALGGGEGTTGGGSAAGGGTGTTGGGSGTGGGASVDCRQWGESCSAEGQCCAVSNLGSPMACSRADRCQEHAPDCREAFFTCSSGTQCCTGTCQGGRCSDYGATCTTALECPNDEACTPAGTCGTGPNLSKCVSAEGCTSKWCDRDGGVTGVCRTPVGCVGHRMTGTCCPGLELSVPSGECREKLGTPCSYITTCASENCLGARCVDASVIPPIPVGQRCGRSASECATTFCDPIGSICTERFCIPEGSPAPWFGCCESNGGQCDFIDGGSCILPYEQNVNAAACCSGATRSGNFGTTVCDQIFFF